MKELDYDKKITLCKKLGADRFKKIVEKVEKLKFKVLKKIFPGYLDMYDKRLDKALENRLKYIKSEETKRQTIREFQRQKMLIRKEHNYEQNRNYHMDNDNPTGIIEYLKWNKSVHKRNLMINGITSAAIGITGIFFPAVLPVLAYEAVDAFLNFQCINIQNCNIYRYEKDRERIEKFGEKIQNKNVKKYSEIAKVISKKLDEKEKADIPKPQEIHSGITTKEELFQAMDLAIDELKARGLIERADALNQKKMEAMNKYEVSGGKVKIYE